MKKEKVILWLKALAGLVGFVLVFLAYYGDALGVALGLREP